MPAPEVREVGVMQAIDDRRWVGVLPKKGGAFPIPKPDAICSIGWMPVGLGIFMGELLSHIVAEDEVVLHSVDGALGPKSPAAVKSCVSPIISSKVSLGGKSTVRLRGLRDRGECSLALDPVKELERDGGT